MNALPAKAPGCIVPDDIVVWAADYIRQCALTRLARHDRFSLALSGGSTPLPLYARLAQKPYRSRIPWNDCYLFWVDERMVAQSSPDSNYGQALASLITPLGLKRQQVFPMQHPTLDANRTAAAYAETLKQVLDPPPNRLPCLDLVILGVGEDGHTASLFPAETHDDHSKTWVKSVVGGNPNVPRTTLTFPLLNAARRILVMVAGEKKAGVVRRALVDQKGALPIERIRPTDGRLIWLLDKAAASLLPASMQTSTN
jgi:6-phosphogluconolactonase